MNCEETFQEIRDIKSPKERVEALKKFSRLIKEQKAKTEILSESILHPKKIQVIQETEEAQESVEVFGEAIEFDEWGFQETPEIRLGPEEAYKPDNEIQDAIQYLEGCLFRIEYLIDNDERASKIGRYMSPMNQLKKLPEKLDFIEKAKVKCKAQNGSPLLEKAIRKDLEILEMIEDWVLIDFATQLSMDGNSTLEDQDLIRSLLNNQIEKAEKAISDVLGSKSNDLVVSHILNYTGPHLRTQALKNALERFEHVHSIPSQN